MKNENKGADFPREIWDKLAKERTAKLESGQMEREWKRNHLLEKRWI